MNEVEQIELDFDKTISFFLDHIEMDTVVSKAIVDKIDFSKGRFFTFLPESADFNKIYDLKHGGILPQNKPMKLPGRAGVFVPIPNINTFLCEYIWQFLSINTQRMVFFEDYNATAKSRKLDVEAAKTSLCGDNFYYSIKHGITLDQIDIVIRKTKLVWYYIILFLENIDELADNLEEKDLEKICAQTTQVVTTAYDGEGFIFWERGNKCS